jgi:hypothetical protein
MLPCPFCGGDARHDAHADDCYFILHRKFKNSGADMSPAFEVLAAWNTRTQQPTQAQAGAVPLTPEAINAMAREYPAEDLCGWSYRMGIADAEQHHGIKGGQHGAE